MHKPEAYSKGCLVENFHFGHPHILLKSDNICIICRYCSFRCVRGQTREGFHYSLAGNSRHVWLFGSPHLEWFSGGRKHRLSSYEGKILTQYTQKRVWKTTQIPHVAPWSSEMSVAQISFERSLAHMNICWCCFDWNLFMIIEDRSSLSKDGWGEPSHTNLTIVD